DFLPSRKGVCYTGTHFNTLTTAAQQAGPNLLNNAYHPNQLGHRYTYAPAIRATLANKLNPSALASLASNEGLLPAASPAPDLNFVPGTLTSNYNPSNQELKIQFTVTNTGNVSSAETEIGFTHQIRTPSTYPTIPLPTLDIGDLYNVNHTLTLQETNLLPSLPFQCPSAPFSGFPQFTDSDEALRYLLSFEQAPFVITLDPSQSTNDLNLPNNTASILASATPADPTGNLANLAANELSSLSSALGTTVTTISTNDLFRSNTIRNHFGFFSPELDIQLLSLGEAIINQQSASLDRCVALELGLNPANPADPQPANGLRPLCLFPLPEDVCSNDTVAKNAEGQLQSLAEIVANAPRDGRSILISSIIDEELLSLLEGELPSFEYTLPTLNPGIESPSEEDPLTTQQPSFSLTSITGATAYTFSLGTQPGANDLYDTALVEPKAGPITTSGLPQDGRTIHATYRVLFADGSSSSEQYTFQTQARNATLLPSQIPGFLSRNENLTWSSPDPLVAGPVEAFALAVGSYPGSGDILPGPEAFSGGTFLNSLNLFPLSPSTNSLEIPGLPSDGRTIYITLGTQRDEEWQYEIFSRTILAASNASLRLPRPDRPLNTLESFQIAPGESEADSFRLLLGTTAGDSDIFDSGLLSPEEAITPFTLALPDLPITLDEEDKPLPIWATIETNGSSTTSESYGLIPSLHASIYTPNPSAYLSPSEDFIISWNPAPLSEGYRLTAYANSSGAQPFFQETYDDSTLSTQLSLEGLPDQAIVLYLETLRPSSETIPTGGFAVTYLVNTPESTFYQGDDIDDLWQLQNFGLANPAGLAFADPDGDGCNNLCEFLARTNPNDPNDFFRASILLDANGSPSAFSIDKPVATTKYQLTDSPDLNQWFNLGSPLQPNLDQSPLTIPLPGFPTLGQTERFYRVEMEP
ncbi:MAG: hypothetical protein AAGC74_12030, partial [Verrucomicrobiota bacterium]